MADVYIGLVHHPVYNKNRDVIASALTTIDMHDLARLAATYGLAGFYVITPLDDQRRLAEEMVNHWRHGWGYQYNRDRSEALDGVRITATIEEAVRDITAAEGIRPLLVATSASDTGRTLTFEEARNSMEGAAPLFIIFGTAWGLTKEALAECDYLLEAVKGPTEYNHLSVRSAAGIIVDRIMGRR